MACKDKTTGTWVAQWYEVDMYGKKKRRKKRGFKTMREAKLYENERTLKEQGDMNMLLKDFMEQYFEDKQNELKERSVRSKKQMMERHVIPYFGDMKMCDITAPQIIKWQNEMYKKGYSESYLRMINNQLTSLFTHAMNVYDLSNNPFLDDYDDDYVCTRILFDDALHRTGEMKQWEGKEIANIMNNAIEGWKPHGTHRFGKEYGIQRSWKRMEDSVKKDKDGFMEVPEQLEIPFE